MRTRQTLLFMAALVFLCFELASAFDNHRQGFVFGGGLGFGYVGIRQSMNYQDNSTDKHTFDESAFVTRVDIGYASENRWSITFANVASILSIKHETSPGASLDRTIVLGMGGPAVTFFLKPEAPSFYVSAGLGIAYHTDALNLTSSKNSAGFGIGFGAGYEISRHFALDADMLLGYPKKSWGGGEEREDHFTMVCVLLRWLGY